jgi:hypothetical protein
MYSIGLVGIVAFPLLGKPTTRVMTFSFLTVSPSLPDDFEAAHRLEQTERRFHLRLRLRGVVIEGACRVAAVLSSAGLNLAAIVVGTRTSSRVGGSLSCSGGLNPDGPGCAWWTTRR